MCVRQPVVARSFAKGPFTIGRAGPRDAHVQWRSKRGRWTPSHSSRAASQWRQCRRECCHTVRLMQARARSPCEHRRCTAPRFRAKARSCSFRRPVALLITGRTLLMLPRDEVELAKHGLHDCLLCALCGLNGKHILQFMNKLAHARGAGLTPFSNHQLTHEQRSCWMLRSFVFVAIIEVSDAALLPL